MPLQLLNCLKLQYDQLQNALQSVRFYLFKDVRELIFRLEVNTKVERTASECSFSVDDCNLPVSTTILLGKLLDLKVRFINKILLNLIAPLLLHKEYEPTGFSQTEIRHKSPLCFCFPSLLPKLRPTPVNKVSALPQSNLRKSQK